MEKLSYEDPQRPKILALDLDGTALKYDGYNPDEFGDPVPGMVEELEKLRRAGWKIVIWTCRGESEEMVRHLEEQEIPYDYINDHPWNGPDDPRKIHADVYADDKALAFEGLSAGFAERVMELQPWWKAADWL